MKAIDIHRCIGNPQNSNIRKLESNILEKAYYGGYQAFEEYLILFEQQLDIGGQDQCTLKVSFKSC